MHLEPKRELPRRIKHILYFIGFLFTVHVAATDFINSSYLEQFIGLDKIGLLYIIASLLSIIIVSNLGTLFAKFGNFATMLTFIIVALLALTGLSFTSIPILAIAFFVIHYSIIVVSRTNFDIYLEQVSTHKNIGETRGSYLSSVNLAWFLAPLLIAFVLRDSVIYQRMYLVSIFIVLVVVVLLFATIRHVKVRHRPSKPFWRTAKVLLHDGHIAKIILIRFLMNFFFAWMTIYTPIYLHETIGFDWKILGVIFSIMLLPYVLFEMPLGKITDKFGGEKEILIVGLVIMAVSVIIMPLITVASIPLWIGVLFLSRIGASFVESMSEIYFFRKISPTNTNAIELFRDSDPLAYIIAPLSASIILIFVSIDQLYFVLGAVMLVAIIIGLRLNGKHEH
ncbi:MAG TPA: MFS transporter [Candidatus Paceibacterota bacterium]